MAKLIRLPEVTSETGLSRSTIYQKIKRGEFPPPIRLGARAVAWESSAIEEWIEEKIQASKAANC